MGCHDRFGNASVGKGAPEISRGASIGKSGISRGGEDGVDGDGRGSIRGELFPNIGMSLLKCVCSV